ncbi:MAG: bifunctional phosphoribosylaminoimidazolecarboxamide formyltransferase/IMP cyclohydrolase [Myxococcota bacterium]
MPHALLSVSDKTGLVPFARRLVDAGFTLLSTGGTARALTEAGLAVTPVEAFTGAPEMMDGRVKTLHPKVHGGILGDRAAHADEAAANGVEWIDVVVVNLYPFEQVTERGGVALAEAVENIDIGGPTMIRSAAKNHRHVAVVVDPADYDRVAELIASGGLDEEARRALALRAFRHTARYDAVISAWLARATGDDGFPDEAALGLRKVQALRYGENPHQQAAFYGDAGGPEAGARSLARLRQHQGKELSFNNLADLDAAVRAVFELDGPGAVVVKHHNPCGAAVSRAGLVAAFEQALAGDPVSAYGGIVAFNQPIGGEVVRAIKSSKTFFEVIVAPGFDDVALERLASRENLRVVSLPAGWADGRPPGRDARRVQGGWLFQDWDLGAPVAWNVVTKRAPTEGEAATLRFAWALCRSVKSNAIALAVDTGEGAAANGVGAGQTNRVDSVRIAVSRATKPVPGSVLASDAFFPFADGLQVAAEAGVKAVIQPGGSIRDEEVIAAADAAGMAMVFTGARHFRH